MSGAKNQVTTPVNIVANASQPVPAAASAGAGKAQQADTGNLFAVLLGLTGGAAASGDADGAPGATAQAGNGASPLFDLAALLGAAGTNAQGAETPEELDKALKDLLEKLKQAADPTSGQPVPVPAQLAQLGDLAKSVADLLDKLQAAGSAPPADQLSALADKLQQLADKLSAPPAASADAAPPAKVSPDQPHPPAKAAPLAGDALAALQKLGDQLGDLAQKIDHLAQKQQTPADPTNVKPAAGGDAEIANMVSMLYGDRPAGQRGATDKPAANKDGIKISSAAAGQNAAQTSSSATVPPAQLLADQQKSGPQNGDRKPELTLAAASAASPVADTPDAPSDTKTDPLLMAQSAQGAVQKTDFAAALKPATAPYQQPSPQINLPQLAFEMASQIKAGNSHFQIRLDPPEMGRIDVKMDIDHTGNLHAKLTVERADTLDLLQRDSRGLERALQQAGVDHSRTNLEFSLKQNPFARQDQHPGGQPRTPFAPALADNDGSAAEASEIPAISAARFYRGTASPGGLNMLA